MVIPESADPSRTNAAGRKLHVDLLTGNRTSCYEPSMPTMLIIHRFKFDMERKGTRPSREDRESYKWRKKG